MPQSNKFKEVYFNKNLKIKSKKNFCFAKNTSYGCGGLAQIAYFPNNIIAAEKVFDAAVRGRYVILGNGSNVLASDEFYNGTVISTKNLSGIYRVSQNTICALAGTKISTLLNYCIKNGFGGLEYLCGIPASVGGAAYMNAGANGKYIGENIVKVRVYNGHRFDLSNKACKFDYKHSTMCDINCIILSIFLKIVPNCNKFVIRDKMCAIMQKRACLPKGKSCGCVFKNIGGVSAGKIIQNCGLANLSYGCARVSEKHCNFILNEGASAFDIRRLIKHVKSEVKNILNVELEEEVIYIGDFNDFDG